MDTILSPSERNIGDTQLLQPRLFRYKRALHGFLSSSNAYNRRFDDITTQVLRMERCVDESLLHDVGDMETH